MVEEEARVAAAPVEFAEALGVPEMPQSLAPGAGLGMAAMMKAPAPPPVPAYDARSAISREALERAAPVSTTGQALGELFQYGIGTPVTVQRGHSAMVPIVSSNLAYHKDLIYNGDKMPARPLATLRLKNDTGLVLERGPVTVIEGDEYVGEAVLPFTLTGGEVVVPYAVELGIKIREESGASREIRGLNVRGIYLHVEEWDVRWREYQLHSSASQPMTVLVEHLWTAQYELFDSPDPKERTGEHLRFTVEVPAHSETRLRVQERRLISRREELRQQSYQGLQAYVRRGLLDQATYDVLAELLRLWERIFADEKRLVEGEQERQRIYKAQQQIQGNMGALSTAGKEGTLRARYVEQLGTSEDQLKTLAQHESDVRAEIERLKGEIETRMKALG